MNIYHTLILSVTLHVGVLFAFSGNGIETEGPFEVQAQQPIIVSMLPPIPNPFIEKREAERNTTQSDPTDEIENFILDVNPDLYFKEEYEKPIYCPINKVDGQT